ncbi:fragile X mental retardation 1 neighbor protein [Sphaerodactylus townsendi]|uniref:fragile X mental retardation 1 neighbor protein n=1 Tax=Sphaerodactylus townsendi TaxID=933632 RepID=UPI0020262F29|nr:fragile X mental retardation 1 neighbor protein [Sphaerodactylus townsendi]
MRVMKVESAANVFLSSLIGILEMISVILILAKCLFLMYRAISPSFASSTQHDLNGTKVALRESRTNPEIISKQLVDFFNPMTCRPRENQVVQPCLAGANINETLCLKQGCCPVYKGHVKLNCYAPLKDRALRTLRVCCIGAAGLFVFGCLPFCCVFVEKSPCANPLRRATKDKDLQEDSEESSESQYKDSSQDEEEVPELQKKGRN